MGHLYHGYVTVITSLGTWHGHWIGDSKPKPLSTDLRPRRPRLPWLPWRGTSTRVWPANVADQPRPVFWRNGKKILENMKQIVGLIDVLSRFCDSDRRDRVFLESPSNRINIDINRISRYQHHQPVKVDDLWMKNAVPKGGQIAMVASDSRWTSSSITQPRAAVWNSSGLLL